MTAPLHCLARALALWLALAPPAAALEEVPYVKTPQAVVDAILSLAQVGADDTLYDLGSGDGRIVITAASRFGARGLGVELDPALVQLSNEKAREAGVGDRARFAQQDLFDTDLSPATVVTMYLLPDVNLALRPKLLGTLRPGTRIVSHDWDLGDWRPDRTLTVPAPGKPVGREPVSRLHLWVVPAAVEGRWRGRVAGAGRPRAIALAIEQRYQDVSVAVSLGNSAPVRATGTMAGAAIAFEAGADKAPMRFEGRLQGTRLAGEATVDGRRVRWSVARLP
jgi:hypothetical protein